MEAQRTTGLLFVLSVLIAVAWTYPTTVPPTPEVCSKMTPGHGPSPQASQSPYSIEVSTTDVKGGNNVQVTLDGNGHTFKGFYVQARDSTGARIGTFIPDDGIVKVHGCDGIKNNAAHHSGKDNKESVVVYWKAPKEYNGQVTFVATFVEEFESFWTNVKSEPVTVSSFSKLDIISHPAFIDSREERATPKATQESRILNYNPYSPFSPLKNEEFDSNEFLKSNQNREIQVNTNFSREPSKPALRSASARIRKSYYIPKIPIDEAITNEGIDNCQFHSHHVPIPSVIGDVGVSKIPESNFINRYTYMRGHPAVSVLHSSTATTPNPKPGPVRGGFHYLDSRYENRAPNHGVIPTTSRKVKFYDDSSSSPLHHFRPNYFPPSEINLHDFHRGPSPVYSKPEHGDYLSARPVYSAGWSQSQIPPATQYGTITNDYGTIDTAIVLPKNMEAFDIPKYGYLVYNPKRGPPFYIIPAETEAFENAHFGFGRSQKRQK